MECAPPRGFPEPTVMWRKDEHELPRDSDRFKVHQSGNLIIEDVSLLDLFLGNELFVILGPTLRQWSLHVRRLEYGRRTCIGSSSIICFGETKFFGEFFAILVGFLKDLQKVCVLCEKRKL